VAKTPKSIGKNCWRSRKKSNTRCSSIICAQAVADRTSSGDGDRAKAKAPSLPRLHQLLIHKFERFGADTDISSEWIVHSG
jgi:hypothetical protein